jgi:glycosyltransferase involved in cell wall biosynthesis
VTSHPAFTVIIPAHNEEAVIGRCLETILRDAPVGHAMEIIVAANGCKDRTAELARAAAPEAQVLDLAQGSKTGAINAANDIASHFPRIYLDADVECGFVTLAALANALTEPGVMTAAPAIRMDFSRLNWLARAYYRVWLRQPYATAGKGGAGCYGLSRAAIEAIGRFPPIIADDLWIHTRFPDSQKRYIASDAEGRPVFTTVHPPRTATEQVRIEARRQIGTAEVHQLHPSPYLAGHGGKGGLGAALRSGVSPLDLAVFSAVKLFARADARWRQLRGKAGVWTRDLSSRQA